MGCGLVTQRLEEVGFSSGLLTRLVLLWWNSQKMTAAGERLWNATRTQSILLGFLTDPEDSGCSSVPSLKPFPNFSPIGHLLRTPGGLRDGASGCCTGLLANSSLLVQWLWSWVLDTATLSSKISSKKPVVNLADATHFLLRPAHLDTFPGTGKEGIGKGKPYLFFFVNIF